MEPTLAEWKSLFGTDTPKDEVVREMNALMQKYGLNLTMGYDYCVYPIQWGGRCYNCDTSARRANLHDEREIVQELREDILEKMCDATARIRQEGKRRYGYKK
jgi:hypothetical protein